MIIDLWVEGERLDLYSDATIKHTFQVNDISELKDRQTSFTNSFSAPKTNNNVRILKGLGLPSDTSRVPYLKPDCKMKYEGFDVIVKGWMNVTDTGDNYKIYLYSGIIEFFKAIENKTLGNDLDLSELNHIKDLSSVINSYSGNSPYRYFLADYNGQTHFLSNPDIINIDYLVPSVRLKYLWDKIHDQFNFPYDGEIFDSVDFNNFWLTFPKAPNISELYKLLTEANNSQIWQPNFSTYFPLLPNSTAGAAWRYSQYLDVPEDGNYRIRFEVNVSNVFSNVNFWMGINSEGIPLQNITNKLLLVSVSTSQTITKEFFISLTAGSVLQLFFEKGGIPTALPIGFTFGIRIEKVNKEDVNFQDGLADFSIQDFVKEVINVHALTIFPKEHSNQLKYKTIAERVRTAEVIDWSDKYIERTNEEYISTNYAQRNFFQYQYNDKEGTYYDGYIDVSNQNIAASKTIFKSRTYAPERIKTKFFLNNLTEIDADVFKFYEKQPDDNPSNAPKYKGLEKRFYFMKQVPGSHSVVIGSEATNESQSISTAVVGSFNGLDWQNLLGKYYGDYTTILNDSRLHTIDLDCNIIDMIHLDFEKLYYFRQEQQYYLLNKINFDLKKSPGEFIRVKRVVDAALINLGVAIDWIDGNINTTTTRSNYDAVATITGTPTYTWQKRLNNSPWTDLSANITNINLLFGFGLNEFRVSYTNGIDSGFSNSIYYERKVEVDPTKCYRFDFTSLQALPRTIEFINHLGQSTSTILNFASPTEVKSLVAKQIINSGGATFVNQVVVDCPVVPCFSYEASKYAGSGDDLWVEYIDCDGFHQYSSQMGTGVGQFLTIGPFCAKEGTVSTNGNLNELGIC